jgi:vacuolar-type H+-ATPase subunit I/STV1
MSTQQTSTTVNFEHRFDLDGSANPKYVDVLDEDKPLSGQRFACLSFISPEKILKQRDLFNFEAFLKQWDMNKSLQKYNHFMSFLAYKYGLNFDNLTKDLQEFCSEEKENLFTYTIEDDYKNFIDLNEQKLDEEFNSTHKFQTSVRGVKVRGSYPSQQEAELRCKLLREVDPNHDVFVGPVGMWMPFHPEAYKTGRVEYLEDELNQLMHEKDKNEKQAKTEFDTRVRESKEKAIADNMKKALESGNVLTQTINSEGQLVSVKDMNTTELGLNENSSLSDIRKELFEGENVVTDFKNSDHGLSELTNKHM